ncbi:MAG: hypothetical protein CR967_04390 [Proteobacteria bacterium]|nr:MAG: hypothetical protein CR967_04390 [Pseudomonadota bacterium]
MGRVVLVVCSVFLTIGAYEVKADASNAMPAIISYLLSGNASTSKLLKTGQTKCYNFVTNNEEVCTQGHKGQDGYYQKGIGRNYFVPLFSAMVEDRATGLTWTDGTIWSAEFIRKKWSQAKQYCWNLNVDGGNWRLPSIDELGTIIDYGRYEGDDKNSSGAINPIFKYGSNTSSKSPALFYFWSSTVSLYDPNKSWTTEFFYGGELEQTNTDSSHYNHVVRCVKGDPFEPFAKNPVTSNNGMATDNDSGLMWQDNGDVGVVEKKWKEAIEYCESLTLGGYADWRLPNIIELLSITNKADKFDPSLKDGFVKRISGSFWSSTTYLPMPQYAWTVGFLKGSSFKKHKDHDYHRYIRCVR